MYQYLFDEDTTNKIKESTSKTKSVLDKFNDIDKKYSTGNKVDSKISLEKISYNVPTQDEVLKKAENSLYDYKTSKQEAINDDYNLQNEQINQSINSIKEDKKEQQAEIENTYSKVKENASNDAIKRGLARSSIIVNKLENYDNKMLNDLAVLSSQTSEKINTLNTQKNTLELEKNNALKSFDIEYAIKLQEKIDSLNEDIFKNEQSVIKYNNEISEIEAKWNKEVEQENNDREMDMANFIAKYGIYEVNAIKQNEKYQVAKEYLSSLDKQSALSELENNSAYKSNLGETLYVKLLKELQG